MRISPQTTASFDVDPQRGFTPLCPDELPVTDGHLIAAELNAQAAFARLRLVSKDCHPPQAPWMACCPEQILQPVQGNYPNLDVMWPPHCISGTEGNRLIPGLPDEYRYDRVVEKGSDPLMHPYGACFHDLHETLSTGVMEWLHQQQIEQVILGGLATDFCVKTTALQLRRGGFDVILNQAACRGVASTSTADALAEMAAAGVTLIGNSCELRLP